MLLVDGCLLTFYVFSRLVEIEFLLTKLKARKLLVQCTEGLSKMINSWFPENISKGMF